MKKQNHGQTTVPWRGKCAGQALIIGIVFIATLLTLGIALTNRAMQTRIQERRGSLRLQAREIAEAGIAKSIYCLSETTGANCGGTFGVNYAGEVDVPFGTGVFSTTLAMILGGEGQDVQEITSVASIPTSNSPELQIRVKTHLSRTTVGGKFHYGLQTDVGGIVMENNSRINGNVYSNGDIVGATGDESSSRIIGDAIVAMPRPEALHQSDEIYNSEFRFGFNDSKTDISQRFIPTQNAILSTVALYIRKVGNPNNIKFYITTEVNGSPSKNKKIGEGYIYASEVGTSLSWVRANLTTIPALVKGRAYWIVLSADPSSSKYWYAGQDSLDSYPRGTGKYSSDWNTDNWMISGSDFDFRVYINGVPTKISDMAVGNDAWASRFVHGTVGRDVRTSSTISSSTIGRDAYARVITGSTIGRDAYATTITGSTIGGGTFSGNGIEEPSVTNYPITDDMITRWKMQAEIGGTYQGNYVVRNSIPARLGPIKINGDLIVDSEELLTVTGTIYVTGIIDIHGHANVALDSGYGTLSGLLVSDKGINIENDAVLQGSGQSGSYIMFIAAGFEPLSNDAVVLLRNNSDSAIIFAPYGRVRVENNARAKQITAFSIYIKNNAIITYETGLADVLFSSGPGGNWGIVPGTWRELP